jgi:hypothetical protein
MRAVVCAVVAVFALAAHPALAQSDRDSVTFWNRVQANCNASAGKISGDFGPRIAKVAIDEFNSFGGHRIDANGQIFHFGLTEAEHEEDEGGSARTTLGRIGWWQVMKYWRTLFGGDPTDKLEVRGYRDASTSTQDSQDTELLRTSAADLLRAAESVSDPMAREVLREAALRAAVVDTSWWAAFISYVVRQAGVAPSAFQFSNAHRAYIYDAFATSTAEAGGATDEHVYRACPLATTRPHVGDLLCAQREPAMTEDSEQVVRERIREELAGPADKRSVRRTHCEVVASIDARARKMYTIGGNVNQAVTARKLNLRRDMKFSATQSGPCGGPGHWTLPQPSTDGHGPEKCSLNDKKWFVLLQLR